jgi:hypothetical protein
MGQVEGGRLGGRWCVGWCVPLFKQENTPGCVVVEQCSLIGLCELIEGASTHVRMDIADASSILSLVNNPRSLKEALGFIFHLKNPGSLENRSGS